MFDRVKVRALAGTLGIFKDLSRSHSCIVLAVCLGLLEGEPSPQFEVLSALELVLINDLSTFRSSFP